MEKLYKYKIEHRCKKRNNKWNALLLGVGYSDGWREAKTVVSDDERKREMLYKYKIKCGDGSRKDNKWKPLLWWICRWSGG